MAIRASFKIEALGQTKEGTDTLCLRCWKAKQSLYVGDRIETVTLQRPEDGASCGYCGAHREPIGDLWILSNRGRFLVTDEGGSCGAEFPTMEEAKCWIKSL